MGSTVCLFMAHKSSVQLMTAQAHRIQLLYCKEHFHTVHIYNVKLKFWLGKSYTVLSMGIYLNIASVSQTFHRNTHSCELYISSLFRMLYNYNWITYTGNISYRSFNLI